MHLSPELAYFLFHGFVGFLQLFQLPLHSPHLDDIAPLILDEIHKLTQLGQLEGAGSQLHAEAVQLIRVGHQLCTWCESV